MWSADGALRSLRREFRHKHVVYCYARGREYKEIEPKVHEGNGLDSFYLKRLQKQYDVQVREKVMA